MRLIFIDQDCVKRISGDAVLDVSGAVVMNEPPEAAGIPMRLVKLIGGIVTTVPEPPLTPEQIAARATKEELDLAMRKIFLVAFNHENRIRALEGKAAITKAQFKMALEGF